MIIDKDTGAVHTDDFIITPQLIRSEFLAAMGHLIINTHKESSTKDYVGIRLRDMSKHPFLLMIVLYFLDQRLTGIHLKVYTPDYDGNSRSATAEYLTKLLSDSIVRANLGEPHESVVYVPMLPEGERVRNLSYRFDWGRVSSYYEDRGGGFGIGIDYSLTKQ